jgi:hypothetical protein
MNFSLEIMLCLRNIRYFMFLNVIDCLRRSTPSGRRGRWFESSRIDFLLQITALSRIKTEKQAADFD